MSTSSPVFLTPEVCASLPWPIAERVDEMLHEMETHGEHTTADETADVIEALMAHLGRLWVAEYLYAGPDDTELNRDLMERMGRSPLVGQWVGLSRRIRQAMAGRSTIVEGLSDLDFGSYGDKDHPVARLVSYRNSFGHGSMAGVVADIREHRELIAEVIQTVPGLWNQPILVTSPETGVCHEAVRDWPASQSADPAVEPLRPYLLGRGGERLELYPLYYLAESDEGHALASSFSSRAAHPVRRLFEFSRMADWHERYQHEARGHLSEDDRGQTWIGQHGGAPWPEGSPGPRESISEAFDADQNLILVEGHPGTGAARALAGTLDGSFDLGMFDAVIGWKVEVRQLTQSGTTFAQTILRTMESLLGHEEGHYAANVADVLTTLRDGMADLREAQKRILMVVEGVHRGVEPYRGEPTTLLAVYRALSHGPVTVLATATPGGTAVTEKIPFDARIPWPIPGQVNTQVLDESVRSLCEGRPIHRRVLTQLVRLDEPTHLFALCDALEAEGEAVFEPAVERALWDMRPILSVGRETCEIEGKAERVRLWRPFSPGVAGALETLEVSA